MTQPAGPIPPLLLVGCGQMGSAMLAGWLADGLAPSVILDRHRADGPAPHRIVRQAADLPDDFTPALIVLATKPQKAAAVIPDIARFARRAPVLSVMAGKTVGGLAASLADAGAPGAVVIRAMPNTPAAIGQGMTVCYAPPAATEAERALCGRVLSAVGDTAWVEHEEQMDAVTAVSGSGPAYVFLLAELMEQAAVAQGLPPDLARRIARRTVSGAGALMEQSGVDAAELRRRVTSPGGTTQQALAVLMEPEAWPAAMDAAIRAATLRAHELAS
ncbi:pyrroline-5-carboxylate reductase [Gluconacetobacter diazotrophicus]|uniref:Pyrroline-5-carboxylate reductase n=2 Tax=Gluconacetobacter diazotrophicus TaxID=33996 RepID=A9HBX1_GLUDA|nr:pyrroline-5-carboxylate reductase [Gluconacetobacter diazotrophicus]MBB2156184.1 pyrroline-5-carboxylate reductase [Gluconacetobacter diazotrophicus]CAP54868.1 putative pyrroline-5-carboxylate reductase [Gluconacetobacter diazotrophicus PA1 5]